MFYVEQPYVVYTRTKYTTCLNKSIEHYKNINLISRIKFKY